MNQPHNNQHNINQPHNNQPYNNQRQQPPKYELPPRECWDWWKGKEYPVDCETGDWL